MARSPFPDAPLPWIRIRARVRAAFDARARTAALVFVLAASGATGTAHRTARRFAAGGASARAAGTSATRVATNATRWGAPAAPGLASSGQTAAGRAARPRVRCSAARTGLAGPTAGRRPALVGGGRTAAPSTGTATRRCAAERRSAALAAFQRSFRHSRCCCHRSRTCRHFHLRPSPRHRRRS